MFPRFKIQRSIRNFVFCCFVVTPVAAQEAIDEIVVVADYRGRTVAELPSAISLLDAEAVSGLAVQHFEELIGVLPNMNWSGDGHRARYLQIRGIGELAQYQGAPNPSVGFIIDDIDFSGIGTIATLFDVDRIEVLRGPQGTRYGANALAGLVYLQSTEPGSDTSGLLTLTAGQDDAFGGGVAIGGPMGFAGGYRISAHHYQSNGFRDNPFLGRDDTNARDETTVRGKLAWEAGSSWSFKLAALYARVDDGYDAFAIDNSLTVLSDKPGMDSQQSHGASLRAEWGGAEAFSLTSITAFADTDIDFSFDADWGNDDAWDPVLYDYVSLNDRQRSTISQEFRLTSTDGGRILNGKADWLLGLYVNRMDEDLTTINRGEYFDPGYDFADSLDSIVTSDFEAMNAAIFGQLDFEMSADSRLTVGARVEHRTTDYADTDGLDLGPSETMVGGQIAWSQTINERTTGFVSLTRGYKAGGFNLGFVPEGRRSFDQESVLNLESGIRMRLTGGRLRLSGSVFYSRRQDQQVETSFQLNPNDPASFVFFADNAATGKTIGLESELQWFATEGIQLYANVGLLNAEFDEFVTPQVDISGRDQAHAPAYTLAIGGIFRSRAGYFGRVDVTAKDEFYFDPSHDEQSEAYAVTNLRLGYEADRWTAQLWVRNAFDEHYAVRGFYFGNEPPDFPAALYIRQGDPSSCRH
jgi:outer membrane receptor protein involved in Fe transport